MIHKALSSELPLELIYSEHVCECTRSLSPEVSAFVGELILPLDDLHDPKLLAVSYYRLGASCSGLNQLSRAIQSDEKTREYFQQAGL